MAKVVITIEDKFEHGKNTVKVFAEFDPKLVSADILVNGEIDESRLTRAQMIGMSLVAGMQNNLSATPMRAYETPAALRAGEKKQRQ